MFGIQEFICSRAAQGKSENPSSKNRIFSDEPPNKKQQFSRKLL
jgi:hypothetical protein